MKSRFFPVFAGVALFGCVLLLAAPFIKAQAHVIETSAAGVKVSFTRLPADYGLYARDERNIAKVPLAGSILEPGYSRIDVQVLRNGKPMRTWSEQLVYNSKTAEAPFSFTIELESGLYSYDLAISAIGEDFSTTLAEVRNIVSGDVYLVQGQSNAVAPDYYGEGLANQHQRSWIRSFGTSSWYPHEVAEDLEWHIADGEGGNCSGCVGAWALRMAQLIVDVKKVPVGLLNGAVGGTEIAYHMRNDADPADLDTNYGRLLFRARTAGIDGLARAMLWYQGESDGAMDPAEYLDAFDILRNAWLEDYPGLQKIYVFQVRDGCGWPTLALRDMMRRFGDIFPDVEVMSTTAAPGHDWCHFVYGGYRELGTRIARLVGLNFYGLPTDRDIRPPNPSAAFFSDGNRDKVELYFRGSNDSILWDEGSEEYFILDDGSTVISGEVINEDILLLHLDGPSSAATISYKGHLMDGPWVTNGRGVGLLTFDSISIE